MKIEKYDLDNWRTFVLREIIKMGEGSFTDYLWQRIKVHFTLTDDTQKAHYLYTECVLKVLESEGLVRIQNRGIHITRKGIEVARRRKGYCSYVNSLRRHELLHRINDYLATISGCITILSFLFSSINVFFGWADKYVSFLSTIISLIVTMVFRYQYRKNK